MSTLLFRNVRLVDSEQDRTGDLLVRDGKIAEVGKVSSTEAHRVVEGKGKVLTPSFVDLHAHFRDPGLTHKEDIRTGCMAAVHGGYTAVNLMANTKPVCSSMETVRQVREKAAAAGLCDLHQVVSVTHGFDGRTTSHLDGLDGTVRWISEDGLGVQSTAVMLEAMEKARGMGVGIMVHAEDGALTKADSYLMEELETFRDVRLAQYTGCRTHFCHVSTREAMDHILAAKKTCGHITCEVTPHHLYLTDANPGRVAPPLRREEHRQYLIRCVREGLVDAIATDHAPHTPEEKAAGANGFTGLDLSFATCYTVLVRGGHITLSRLSRLMSRSPAALLGVEGGLLRPGMPANLVLLDPEAAFVVEEDCIHSKSKNTPLMGETLYGKIYMTIKEGRAVYEETAD